MSKQHLNAIATRALVDKKFQLGVLNGQRKEMLSEFPLPDKDMRALLAMKEVSLDKFIERLGKLTKVYSFP